MSKLEDSEVSVLYKSNGTKLLSNNDGERSSSSERVTESSEWTPMLILAGATCCFGSALPAGYNIGVMNNAAEIMISFCNESVEERYGIKISQTSLDTLWSTIVSIFLIGGVTGSLTATVFANKLGRRFALATGNICGIIGAIMLFLVQILNSIELFLLGRLFVGFSGGLATSLLPTYMTEVAPLKLRGAVGVLCQLGITCGVLLGQIISLNSVLGTEDHWPYMLAAFGPLSLIAFVLIFILPESPKYLFVIAGRRESGLRALSMFRNKDRIHLQSQINDLEAELAAKSSDKSWTIAQVLKEPTLKLPVMLVSLLQFGQQLSGVNAVFYYSNVIFKAAKLDIETSQYATIGTGVINVLMALISVPVMSRFGRKVLLFISAYTSIVSLLVLCVSIVFINIAAMQIISIIAVQAFVLFYGIGLGPIPYFIGSELFDVGPRSAAMSIGSICNWGGNFVVGMTFPQLQKLLGPYSFLVFVGAILFLIIFCRKYLPETRGRATTEIAATLTQGLKSRPNEPAADLNST
ncbi:solute carrier family 2, facilitated glucose transporter member 1-like isoform X2 [Phymastichus coffea]|uniref:solute carrier family 2, facilitated glucose transporter member 1-like isoform X2 n=1 Tax=Phymastichus coffea TaxID=108790 RepID=UPI00273C9B5C|nr:solute carrier family 2, facilitated glucose transporter member 1-like isoform X2 [Phymastichus coffea]